MIYNSDKKNESELSTKKDAYQMMVNETKNGS